jgi:hypothetical protein
MRIRSDMWRVTEDLRIANCELRFTTARQEPRPTRLRFATTRQAGGAAAPPYQISGTRGTRPSENRRGERGIALIITLIMLSVTLIMALAFLAVSRRERASVTTSTDAANSRLAADAALASAEAQIVADISAGGVNSAGSPAANPFNFGLLVSTNYTYPGGFSIAPADYTNLYDVNYYYPASAGGGPVTGNDYLQLLANLYYSPRLPVYIPQNGTNDFRFYLDLNRNGEFDDSGIVPNVTLTNGTLQTNGSIYEVGDPQWIGLLEHPDQPYGPNNKAIARFAFIAVPVGSGLDLNAIHNQTLNYPSSGSASSSSSINPGSRYSDGYYRNQGVGTWEINLAAFLTDLNTNEWDSTSSGTYEYNQANPPSMGGASPNSGASFDDSRALLAYRYNNNYYTLATANNLFNFNNPNYFNFFAVGGVDAYGDLPLQTNFDTNYTLYASQTPLPWAGADNTNHFYDLPSDLFNGADTTVGAPAANINNGTDFPGRLAAAGTTNTTYDRYTFYRMLSQLGTDTSPESGKMNLNYDNLDPYITNNVTYQPSETNFMPWTPIAFFTNAADRILKTYTGIWATNYTNYVVAGVATNFMPTLSTNFVATYNMTNAFGISDIPVYVSNTFVYTPAVNRLLQLAANLYDATTTNYYPSVFRPLFTVTNQNGWVNVYITGYTNVVGVNGTGDGQLTPPIDLVTLLTTNGTYINAPINVYGVPWIIGAKKGFPNFNEAMTEDMVGITRRLQFVRDISNPSSTQPPPILQTNQMYMFSVNSDGGLDFWNSYSGGFTNLGYPVVVDYRLISWATLTNSDTYQYASGYVPQDPVLTNAPSMGFSASNSITFNTGWPGTGSQPWRGGQPNSSSFYIPLNFTNFLYMSNAVYRTSAASIAQGTLPPNFPSGPALIWTNYFNLAGDAMTAVFETNLPHGNQPGDCFYVPQWGLLTTNQLQVYILAEDPSGTYYHVVDYVHLEQSSVNNLNNDIFVDDNEGIWNTNASKYPGLPQGIYNQIAISEGLAPNGVGIAGEPPGEDGGYNGWQPDQEAANYGTTVPAQQASFQAFMDERYGRNANVSDPYGSATASNILASMQAPYAPTRYALAYTVLQANDPLVHYLTSQMTLNLPMNVTNHVDNFLSEVPPPTAQPFTLGQLNSNYRPWGGNPYANENSDSQTIGNVDSLAYNLEERDPLAEVSDNWDFPTNKLPNIGWIGRVHRGTPWQTVYMKSTDITKQSYPLSGQQLTAGLSVWAQWTGDQQFMNGQPFDYDALNSAPNQDRLLFDLFTAGINDNATRGQLSVNTAADQYDPDANPAAGLAGWSAVLSGVVVPQVPGTTNSYSVISPAGGLGANSALYQVVTNINATRNAYVGLDGLAGTFEHKGDILAAPMLTVQSPFLNLAQSNQFNNEMYEWVPQQIMGMVRGRAMPRYVIYCYGQTLQPAPNGIYTGNYTSPAGESVFGMVTNYQVTAESATRVVLRIDGLTDANGNPLPQSQQHPHAVIESINTLPPD